MTEADPVIQTPLGRFSFFGTGESVDPGWLSRDESRAIDNAVMKRRLEFSTGRWCAHRALEALGQRPGSIPVGEGRGPVWPDTFSGSISHTDGYACALVTDARVTVGIDVETAVKSHAPGIWRLVMTPEESGMCRNDLERLIVFSAKESFYKALYPHVKAFIEFKAVKFQSDWNGRFRLTATHDFGLNVEKGAIFEGCYSDSGILVFTWMVVEKPGEGFRAGLEYGAKAAMPIGNDSPMPRRLFPHEPRSA